MKVPKGRKADLNYLFLSPYFLLNFASLFIYPACRLLGMQNRAQSTFSESVSCHPIKLSFDFRVDFRKRSWISCICAFVDLPCCEILCVEHMGTFLLVSVPLWKMCLHNALSHDQCEGCCLLHSALLHSVAHFKSSEVQAGFQVDSGTESSWIGRAARLDVGGWAVQALEEGRQVSITIEEGLVKCEDDNTGLHSSMGRSVLLYLPALGQVCKPLLNFEGAVHWV